MEGIEISLGQVGARRDISMLTVKGYVDTMTCSLLLNRITELLNGGVFHIIVDMAQVSYVSSAGWGVFVGEIKSIREKGGDLKIVQMTPEVYDVFEMLEFNKILSYYESIEEAINDSDLSIGLDITKSVTRSYRPEAPDVAKTAPSVAQRPVQKSEARDSGQFSFNKSKVDKKILPLTEKIKLAIIEDPRRGVFKLKKELKKERFGYTKVSALRIYRTLRKLSLEDKDKRYRFYRSR
ncbi:STAS domain-containing protein [candidate division KSB1 bacterium]|nr:STAS domain-containing protein [candidate division KSB1 bacterium]NIR72164.1 STAS domain-containing protein [candidate division KSB1 bacterium]NIS26629.1 STAS domain-containing protein [candidate division KSB1 bacterium]NIT73397.1 STAS domain-containing protein [candidate division KSB1 bacterium]NIU27245.1 STAS domain-containing protein [candidate division KSB1 bacterium]